MQDERHDLAHNAVWLGKKSRLCGPILRVAKIAQADANQAKTAGVVGGHATAHRAPALPGYKTYRLIVEECSCERCRK